MQKVVLDSDIIIDHFRQGSGIFDLLVMDSAENKTKVYLPGIVYTEINGGHDSKKADKLKQIKQLPIMFEFIPADQQISQQAGFLIRDYANLGTADALVAATALFLNAKLATRNKKDFEGIEGLKFFKLLN